jgi:hypothetical protein
MYMDVKNKMNITNESSAFTFNSPCGIVKITNTEGDCRQWFKLHKKCKDCYGTGIILHSDVNVTFDLSKLKSHKSQEKWRFYNCNGRTEEQNELERILFG